jgi:thiol-disulfide isomerase/thioredoxin
MMIFDIKRNVLIFLLCIFCHCNSTDSLINGADIPDVSLPTPAGQDLALSSVFGQNKIVLMDFWASWCKPCRESSPELIRIYNKYKDAKFETADGFTIYSVSLDTDKQKWQKAIEKDGLLWPNHVSDLKGFGSECVNTFQFNAIPHYYLIDERGIIIGKNLTAKWLDYELGRRLKKE